MLKCLLFGHELEHFGEDQEGILSYDIGEVKLQEATYSKRRIITCCKRCNKVVSYIRESLLRNKTAPKSNLGIG